MRCLFVDGTTEETVRELIEFYEFDTLRNFNSLTKDEKGLRLLFQDGEKLDENGENLSQTGKFWKFSAWSRRDRSACWAHQICW